MDRYFLHTSFSYEDPMGIPVRTHVDCDELPVVNVYSSAGVFIESPTISKTTDFYSLGHYKWTHNWRLYNLGNKYYYIINWIYDNVSMHSEREYFTWGFIKTPEGDAGLGYNRNLFKCLKAGIETYSELIALCPTIRKASSFQANEPSYPVLIISFLPQLKVPGINSNIANIRRTFIRFRFYHTELQDALLLQLNDMLNTFILESDNYDGYKFQDSNDIFYTNSIQVDVMIEDDPPVVWDESLKLYRIGSRFIHDGRCR